ncbi:MAG: peptidase S8 and S53 subtilisin kexin sedolisin [Candidatus Peregrinibacteria bacterium Gr01-1014_25]|nr:MAG: peptidase S8 and S53 subtilisin kexin sedolisin [Candidatus Peregrinibacteria bacterium Gr01-1014_25]
MSSTRSHRSAVLVTALAALTAVIALLPIAQQTTAAFSLAQLFLYNTSRSVRPIPTCRDVGLCPKGERSIVLHSIDAGAIDAAGRKGCRVHRRLRKSTVLRCPSTAFIPYSHDERVFRLHDLYSAQQIGAMTVQERGVTGQGVRVAILDTGVSADHPELAGNVVLTANFTVDDADDQVGHGTHVSGIVAGVGAREFEDRGSLNRALGVAPGAELMSGKVCNNQGWCLEGDIQAGIEWAVAQHARVINLSLGGGAFLGHCDRDPMAEDVNWAVKQGAIVVVAAGNSGDAGEGITSPGCASEAIAVGAVDGQDVRPSWSSYGLAIDVAAPGVGILSSVSCQAAGTCPNAAYGWWSGTSMATPHVAGAVALLLQTQPRLTRDDVYALLASTAKDLGSMGFDKLYGYGRVDALDALDALRESEQRSSSSPLPDGEQSSSTKSERASSATSDHESTPARGGHSEPDASDEPEEREHVPSSLPQLPSNAASAAQEHRPVTPKGSPRW